METKRGREEIRQEKGPNWEWGKPAERPEEKTTGLAAIRSYFLVLQEAPGATGTLICSEPGQIMLILDYIGFCYLLTGRGLLLMNSPQN